MQKRIIDSLQLSQTPQTVTLLPFPAPATASTLVSLLTMVSAAFMVLFAVLLEFVTEEIAGDGATQSAEDTMTSLVAHEVAGSTAGESGPQATLTFWRIRIEGSIGV